MSCVSTDIVSSHFNGGHADWHWTKQVGGQTCDVGQSVPHCSPLNGAANQRDRWTAMLVLGVPRAAREKAGTVGAALQQFIGACGHLFGGHGQCKLWLR